MTEAELKERYPWIEPPPSEELLAMARIQQQEAPAMLVLTRDQHRIWNAHFRRDLLPVVVELFYDKYLDDVFGDRSSYICPLRVPDGGFWQ